jgi:hypothetical protein
MTYTEHHATFARKARAYDMGTCNRALYDCHDTLKLWGEGIAPEYAIKLWAEIDALRERQQALRKAGAA